MTSAALSTFASIPSPDTSYFQVGPLTIHFYALCILTGIVVAAIWTNSRLTRRGAEPWVVIDIALIAVPLAIIGARIFHVVTHPGFYFGEDKDIWAIFRIWEGGIAIFGALIGGAIGAWLGCKWTGIRFWTFADALAPALLLAQALGRFGNWFNQELYGLPTDVPWGLEIDYPNAAWPAGLPEGTLFHPTFLYEVIWNVAGVCVLVWVGRRFALQWGRLFALYLIWYSAGRIVWESIRIDPSEVFLGLRTNVWAAVLGVAVGVAILLVQRRRHLGAEPSPYQKGREWTAPGAVQSQGADDYVDVSAPPTPVASSDQATSSVTTR
ncbi:prolipoprotein diacylglyceryl transferase [Microbacterium sp.]|uniref:prolipoprotein diacylglyceryl transferase n=1 Tax=Microbacterium sp. TaxID=51671 RepID=UPI003736E2B9